MNTGILKEDWNNPLWCCNAIAKDPTNFVKCEYQDEILIKFAINEYSGNILHVQEEFMRYKWYRKLCVQLVKNDSANISLIPEEFQDRTIILDAINNNPNNLRFIKKQTETHQLRAVSKDGMAIKHCSTEPTSKVVRAALRQNPLALSQVPAAYTKKYPEIEKKAMAQDPRAVVFATNPTYEEILAGCREDPEIILLQNNPTIKRLSKDMSFNRIPFPIQVRVTFLQFKQFFSNGRSSKLSKR